MSELGRVAQQVTPPPVEDTLVQPYLDPAAHYQQGIERMGTQGPRIDRMGHLEAIARALSLAIPGRGGVGPPVPPRVPPRVPVAAAAPLGPAPVTFLGWQAMPGGKRFAMWNLTKDIEGHPAGSTLSEAVLKSLGYELPVPPQ